MKRIAVMGVMLSMILGLVACAAAPTPTQPTTPPTTAPAVTTPPTTAPSEPTVPETAAPTQPTEPSIPETQAPTEPSVPETAPPAPTQPTEPSIPETQAPTEPSVPETTPPAPTQPQQTWKSVFTKSGNLYTAVMTTGTPVYGGGLVIEVDTDAHTVRFTICDTAGNRTVEYLHINYSTEMIERFQYVSAMGQGFYYYTDLNGGDMKVFNTAGEDRTQGTIDSNHYDSALEATQEMIASYTAYFSNTFGVTVQNAAMDN